MSNKWNKTEAFSHFDATITNVRWSSSARSRDGKSVILSIWIHRFVPHSEPRRYEDYDEGPNAAWMTSQGNRERLEHLIWSQHNLGGLFKVVMARAKDPTVRPLELDECWPTKMIMKITRLNEQTGQFCAEIATEANIKEATSADSTSPA